MWIASRISVSHGLNIYEMVTKGDEKWLRSPSDIKIEGLCQLIHHLDEKHWLLKPALFSISQQGALDFREF